MRINEVPEINTQMSINSPQKTAGNDDLRLFDFPNPQQNNYFSYFSSPKYLELKSLVEKYNQENSNNVSNDKIQTMYQTIYILYIFNIFNRLV